MSKRSYTTHRAVFSIQFDCHPGADPDETADILVRDMMNDGYGVVLDDVEDVSPSGRDLDKYSYFCFVRDELECGHGQQFKATFCCRHECGDKFCIESVDVSATLDGASQYAIGGVGGELLLECPRNSDGSFNFEQMCRDWLGVWSRRECGGKIEESIFGMYLIIRQIVAEGRWIK